MSKDKMDSKDVRALKLAQWAGFRRLAERLPNHHVLAIELVRTFEDETAAVFTVVRNREPIRMVVFGDARGNVKPPHECHQRYEAMMAMEKAELEPEDQSPDFSLGRPPVTQNPEPGFVALARSLLPGAFDVGEQIGSSK
jgi:hypothetical protein